MNRREKFIAALLILQAVLSAITIATAIFAQHQISFSLVVLIVPTIGAAIAGIAAFRHRAWAWKLATLIFAVQLLSFKTPWFFYSIWLGFHLNIAFSWLGSGEIGINLVAIAMLLLLAKRGHASNNSFKPRPLRGSA